MNQRILLYIIVWLIGIIILPILLQSGYIFAIDQALNTRGWTPQIWWNAYWIGWVSQIFVFFSIPIWVLEKLLVVMTFTLPVLGVYLYFKKYVEMQSRWALFFALSFSIFNPMLYSRFLDGQVNIYIFYALFPLFLYFVKCFFEYKTLLSAIKVGLWSIILVFTTIHAAYFIFFIFLIFGVSNLSTISREKKFLSLFLGITTIFCLQLLWFIPLYMSLSEPESSTIWKINSFDENQQLAFANIPENKNPYIEILSMRWYWGDYENRFVESHDIFNDGSKNDWIIFIWFIIIVWIIYSYKNKTADRYIFLVLWILGFILSLWVTNNTIFTPVNSLLYNFLPYYAGFREPQKFVLFLVIAYIYFGYFGIIAAWDFFKKYKIHSWVAGVVLAFCIISPLLYNFNMLFAFRGQVSVQQYPGEWKEVREYLAENTCEDCKYNTLIFPWHGYMSISWTHKVVPIWVTRYLWKNILFGDTIEIWSVYSSSTRSESKIVEKYIWPSWVLRNNITDEKYIDFLSEVQNIGIQNIVLLKESDYIWYQKILEEMSTKKLLEKSLENNMITIYRIK